MIKQIDVLVEYLRLVADIANLTPFVDQELIANRGGQDTSGGHRDNECLCLEPN